jgi:nitrate reductase gamma subunit
VCGSTQLFAHHAVIFPRKDIIQGDTMTDIFLGLLKLLAKWKPGWLYESMPYIYSVVGITTIYYFASPPGYMAGILFVCAAFMIWMKRKTNRNFRNRIKW